jgi:hypothetical protein
VCVVCASLRSRPIYLSTLNGEVRILIMNTPHSTADDTFVSVVCVEMSAANVTDEAAVESDSPKDESLRPPPDSLKKLSAPETPRWRFVNKAKKTEGYSSSAAGTFVRGAKMMVSWRLVR